MSAVSMAEQAFLRRMPPAGLAAPPPAPVPSAKTPSGDTNITATLKAVTSYIPTEIITIYVAGLAVLFGTNAPSYRYVLAHAVATPVVVWVLFALKVKAVGDPLPLRPSQWPSWEMAAAVVGFAAWVIALQPSPAARWIKPEAGGFLVLVVTTVLGVLGPLFSSSPLPGAGVAGAAPVGGGGPNPQSRSPNPIGPPPPPRAFGFADVQRILEDAVEGHDIGAHGPFWRDINRDVFVAHRVFGCPIIHSESGRFVGPSSPLVRILRGPIECPAGRERPPMPLGLPPVSPEKVQQISDWIDRQCPA